MNLNFGQLLTLDYWFSSRTLEGPFLWILMGFLVLVLIAGIVVDVLLKLRFIIHFRVIYRHISSLLWTMSLIGIIWLFFFYEGIYLLSARIWFIIWLLLAIIWAYFIYKHYKYLKFKYDTILKKKHV